MTSDGILVSAQSSEKEGVTNRNIVSRRAVRFVSGPYIRIYTRSYFRAPHIRDVRGPYS